MTDDKRKLLTEWLGKCWHKWETKEEAAIRSDSGTRDEWPECKSCQARRYHIDENRTFTTAKDMVDLVNELMEKEMWDDFYSHASIEYLLGTRFTNWLMRDPPRFCELVGEFKPWERR